MGFYVGIDLGTTNSTVSVIQTEDEGSSPLDTLQACRIFQFGDFVGNVIADECLPSALFFNVDDKRVYTGQYAKKQYRLGNFPLQTAVSIKTRIGNASSRLTIPSMTNPAKVDVFDMKQCSSFFIRTIADTLKKQFPELGEQVTDECVVTVPAAFNDDERVATRNAVLLGGFKECKILDEPTAALLWHINSIEDDSDDDEDEVTYKLVYDIGGGTLDVSIAKMTMDDEGNYNVDIVGLSDRMNLGGDNFDRLLGAYFLDDFEQVNEPIQSRTKEDQGKIIARIVSEAEDYKIQLNDKILDRLDNPRMLKNVQQVVAFSLIDNMQVNGIVLKKATFDELFKIYTSPTATKFGLLNPIKTALSRSGLNKDDISEVILTGGMANFYSVIETLSNFFGDVPIRTVEDTRTAVSRGAALFHWGLDEENFNAEVKRLSSISNKMASNIYVHGSDGKFHLLISADLKEKEGTFFYKIVDDNVAYFPFYLYSGTEPDNPDDDNTASYVQLAGRMIRSKPEYTKGYEIPIKWSIDDDKVITIQLQDDKNIRLSTLMTADEIKNDKVNQYKVNDE